MMSCFKTMLVLILALLLPIKGVVAAAGMVCAQTAHHQEQALVAAGPHHGALIGTHAHDIDAHETHAHGAHAFDAGQAHSDAGDAGPPDAQSAKGEKTCSVCAACSASTVPLPSSRTGVPLFAAPGGMAAALAAVAYPSHVSPGLERPPRSL